MTAVLFLASPGGSTAQPTETTSAVTGASASTTYDADKNVASISVSNISRKDITAFNLSIDAVYQDGFKDHHEVMIDLLNLMINQTEFGETNPVAFPPGTSHAEPLFPSRIPNHPLLSVNTSVDLVVYADRTVEAANRDALQRLVNARTAHGSAIGEGLAVIKKILASGKDNPSACAVGELQLFHSAPTSKDGGIQIARENQLKFMIDDLERIKQKVADHRLPQPEREYLKEYIAAQTQRMSLTLAHADLGKGRQ